MQKKLYYKGLYGDNSIEFVEGLIHVLEHLLQREADIIVEIDAIHISTIDTEKEKLCAVYKTMKCCIEEYHNHAAGKQLMLESLISQLIVQLHRLSLETTKLPPCSDNARKIYFRRFMQLIIKNIANPDTSGLRGLLSVLKIKPPYKLGVYKAVLFFSRRYRDVKYTEGVSFIPAPKKYASRSPQSNRFPTFSF